MSQYLDHQFTDQEKRLWTVRFDGSSMTKIQEQLNINICDAFADPKKFSQSLKPSQVLQIVWVALEKQAHDQHVTVEQWMESMWGEALIQCNDAFWAALINFSQPEKIRTAAKDLHGKAMRVLDRRQEKMVQELSSLTEEQVEALLDGKYTDPSTNTQATAESTPVQEPSANSNG